MPFLVLTKQTVTIIHSSFLTATKPDIFSLKNISNREHTEVYLNLHIVSDNPRQNTVKQNRLVLTTTSSRHSHFATSHFSEL